MSPKDKGRHSDRTIVPGPSVSGRAHRRFSPVDPEGWPDRRYQCDDCGAVGILSDLIREFGCQPTSKSRVKRLSTQKARKEKDHQIETGEKHDAL